MRFPKAVTGSESLDDRTAAQGSDASGPGPSVPRAARPAAGADLGAPDIVVTAQRRSENAQRTSPAVTALSGQSLIERGVRDIQDLQQVSPSLTISEHLICRTGNGMERAGIPIQRLVGGNDGVGRIPSIAWIFQQARRGGRNG